MRIYASLVMMLLHLLLVGIFKQMQAFFFFKVYARCKEILKLNPYLKILKLL